MSTLNWYAIGALVPLAPVFYFVRKIPVYLLVSFAIVAGFAAASFPAVEAQRIAEWIIMTLGLLLSVFGLLIVRVMLIRSVSLRMLAKINAGERESGNEDIGGRLHDMRAFRLIRTAEGAAELTGFGRFVSGVVALFYWTFRVEA